MSRTRVAVVTSGVVVAAALVFAALPAHAQSIVQCVPFPANATKLVNCDLCELYKMLNTIISIAAGGLVGFSVLALIIGGFRYVTAAGSPGLVEKAKHTIQFAIAGIIVVSLAFVIVKSVTTILGYTADPFSALSCTLPEVPATGGGGGAPSPRPGQQPVGPGATGQYADLLNKAAAKYGMEPCAMEALMNTESSGNAKAINGNGQGSNAGAFDSNNLPYYGLNWDCPKCSYDFGLLQINISGKKSSWIDSNTPSTKRGDKFYTIPELLTPESNIDAGAAYFDYCIKKTNAATYAEAYGACYNGQGANGANAKRYQDFYDTCKARK